MIDWYQQPRYQPFTLRHDDAGGDRPVVLMVHGFTGSPEELRPAARIAHEAGFDVEAMNLPGMGPDIGRFRETGRDDWQAAVQARWAETTARYRKRMIFGYSLGAALAILASASRPADAMVLMSPLVRLADPRAFVLPIAQHVMWEMTPFSTLDFSSPKTREFFEKTMPGLDIDDPEIQRSVRREFVMPTRLINDNRLVGREAGRAARHITEPVTIIQGRPDAIVGHHNARWLVDHLGGPVTYHEVDGDHLIAFDTAPSWPAVRPLLEQTFAGLYERLS
jgi:carboxylesterase